MKKIFLIFISLMILISIVFIFSKNDNIDEIKYNGKIYTYLECKGDIFTYFFNNRNNDYYDPEIIYPVKHKKYDVIYFDGDLFVSKNNSRKAIKYYKDDDNYNWYFVLDTEDEEIEKKIEISREELKYLNNIEDIKKEFSIPFKKIEKMGSLKKLSKDKFIVGRTSLAYYNGFWYWKTEIMDDNDYEYIIKLPESLNKKINDNLNL